MTRELQTAADEPPVRYLLVADDDEDDRRLIADALHESHDRIAIQFVRDGRELLNYLKNQGPYAGNEAAVRPDIVLLDLNMPVMNGRDALSAMKADPTLREIPVVVVSTSNSEEDVRTCYGLGANSYIAKPSGYRDLVDAMARLRAFWLETAELPPS